MVGGDWKLAIGFIADILYFKEIISIDELNDIYNIESPKDLDRILDKHFGGEYDVTYKCKLDREIGI